MWYGQQSTYFWWDAAGQRRTIRQGEGCEQGDALAPALYALGQHDAIAAADAQLRPGECLAAFLDDVYLVITPARARESLDVVTTSIETRAGVAAILGKTRVYNRAGGLAPPGIAELGAGVWRGDAHETERGFVALATPIGHPRFVADARLHEEGRLLHACCPTSCAHGSFSPCVPRLAPTTCCAPSRPTSLPAMRVATTTPSGDVCSRCWAKRTTWTPRSPPHAAAMLPSRLGGLGLQCAARTAPAAYWAARADALHACPARSSPRRRSPLPCRAHPWQRSASAAACLRAAEEAGRVLDRTNWTGATCSTTCAPHNAIFPRSGARAYHGSRTCFTHFREAELLYPLCQPLLRPCSARSRGSLAQRHRSACPTACS